MHILTSLKTIYDPNKENNKFFFKFNLTIILPWISENNFSEKTSQSYTSEENRLVLHGWEVKKPPCSWMKYKVRAKACNMKLKQI